MALNSLNTPFLKGGKKVLKTQRVEINIVLLTTKKINSKFGKIILKFKVFKYRFEGCYMRNYVSSNVQILLIKIYFLNSTKISPVYFAVCIEKQSETV